MYSSLLSLAVVAAGASAQLAQITMPPMLNLAAVNMDDTEACGSVAAALSACVDQVGGEDALLTASPDVLLSCACCLEGDNIASAYSACSTYLTNEIPSFSTEADAYGDIYPACSIQASCSSSGSVDESSTTSDEIVPTETDTELEDIVTRTTSDSEVATACNSMIGMFESCVAETDGFSEMPFISQAPCYCCQTGRGGRVTFNDDLDNYASECADWAITGEPETVYDAASRFASFCDNFSDACDSATATEDSQPTETDEPTESEPTAPTDEPTETNTDQTTPPDAGASLRVGVITTLLGAVALLVAW